MSDQYDKFILKNISEFCLPPPKENSRFPMSSPKKGQTNKSIISKKTIKSDDSDYRQWLHSAPLEYKKKLIAAFVENTLEYGRNHLQTRLKESALLETKSLDAGERAEIERRLQRLVKWSAYLEFQEHTLEELTTQKLDEMIPR